MRAASLILLAIVTLAVSIAAALLPPAGAGSGAETSAAPEPVFADLAAWSDKIRTVSIAGATGTVTLLRGPRNGVWTVLEKGGYPASRPVAPLIQSLARLRQIAPKTALPALYPRLDVALPGKDDAGATLVDLSDGAGRDWRLIIGKRRSDPLTGADDAVYIRRPDAAQSWLAQPALQVASDPFAWIDATIYDLDPSRIASIAVTPNGAPPLRFSRLKGTASMQAAKPASAQSAAALLGAVQTLDLADVRPAMALTAPPDGRITLTTFDGLVLDLAFFQQDGALWVTVKSAGGPDGARIAARGAGWAYKLAEDRAKPLRAALAAP